MAHTGAITDGLRLMGRFPGAGNQAWSERTDLQVQKMEQTIEQDLAKAMGGLREQFRHHPRFGGHLAAGEPAVQETSAGSRVIQPDAAAFSDFRSEAAAARDEMLDGLAGLRRELEAQRQQQTSAIIGPAATENDRQQSQVAAMEAAVTDLRRDLFVQQGALAELRREVSAQSEYSNRCTTMLDRDVNRLTSELGLVQDQRSLALVEEAQHGNVAALHDEVRLLGDRLGRLEQLCRSFAEERAAVGRCLGVVSEMDARLHGVSSALEAERQARASHPAEEDAAKVLQLQTELNAVRQEVSKLSAAVMSELPGLGQHGQELEQTRRLSPEELNRLRGALGGLRVPGKANEVMEDLNVDHERRGADFEELQRRCEGAHQASLASIREITEGLLLECTSRQAQVSELRRSLADDISSSMEAAKEALRADVALQSQQLREELSVHLEALERELRCLGAQCGDAGRPEKEDAITARIAVIEAEANRNLAAMGQPGDVQGDDPQGAHQRRGYFPVGSRDEANSLMDAKQILLPQRSLISQGLKESLEQLVDKVQKTLKPGHDAGAAGAEVQAALLSSAARVPPPRAVVETLQGGSSAGGQVRPTSPMRQVTAPPTCAAPYVLSSGGSVSLSVEGSSPTSAAATHSPPYAFPAVVLGAGQVLGGSCPPATTTAGTAPSLSIQPRTTSLTMLSHPPPVGILPQSTAETGSSHSVPGSAAGSFTLDARSGSPQHPSEVQEPKEASFRRCLQELREENRALREAGQGGPAGSSISFSVAGAQQHLKTVQGAGLAGVLYGGPTVVIPSSGSSLRMTPGLVHSIAPPIGGQQRTVSPTPAIRRNLSPQR